LPILGTRTTFVINNNDAVTALAVFAEFETNLRKERQLGGITAAKARGSYKGCKPSIDAGGAEATRGWPGRYRGRATPWDLARQRVSVAQANGMTDRAGRQRRCGICQPLRAL
jgi:DNA invertase Pin-like site-specific DNA recombinase